MLVKVFFIQVHTPKKKKREDFLEMERKRRGKVGLLIKII